MNRRIAVFGGGMTGLVAARELGRQGHHVDVYEASDHIGGLASTFRDPEGYVYDNGPRFIFSTLAEKIGILEQCEPVKYYEDLYVGGSYYKFPFGFARNPVYALSVGTAMLTRPLRRTPTNLGEFLQTYYGRIFAGQVLIPLIEKWCGRPSIEMSVDFAARLLPTNIAYILYSLVKKLRGGITEDYYRKGRYIVYPRGSNSVIFETLAKSVNVTIHLNAPLTSLDIQGESILGAIVGGRSIKADMYLSTIPIHRIAELTSECPAMHSWRNFHYRGVHILFIKLRRPHLLPYLWTWFPEKRFPFYRIAEFKNAREDLAPADRTLISLEFAIDAEDPIWGRTAEQTLEAVRPHLSDLYKIQSDEILGIDLRKSPFAYPVLRKSTEIEQRALTHQTPLQNLFVAGRTGMFQYRMLEGCYESAVTCVEAMVQSIRGEQETSAGRPIPTDRYGRPLTVPE